MYYSIATAAAIITTIIEATLYKQKRERERERERKIEKEEETVRIDKNWEKLFKHQLANHHLRASMHHRDVISIVTEPIHAIHIVLTLATFHGVQSRKQRLGSRSWQLANTCCILVICAAFFTLTIARIPNRLAKYV